MQRHASAATQFPEGCIQLSEQILAAREASRRDQLQRVPRTREVILSRLGKERDQIRPVLRPRHVVPSQNLEGNQMAQAGDWKVEVREDFDGLCLVNHFSFNTG